MMMIWKCSIPLKVKIFMWMVAHDRIQCAVVTSKKINLMPLGLNGLRVEERNAQL
jgi:hypothetical protein